MQLFGGAAAPKPGGDADIVKTGSLRTFQQDVLQASLNEPVLVEFWSPRSGPAGQISAVLEKVVRGAGGKVRLVRINIDENRALATQLNIQAAPTVYAFLSGQPVTGFAGVQPESQIKALVERLVGEPVGADRGEALATAKELADAGDVQGAAEIFEAVLAEEPADPEALAGLARCLLSVRKIAEAKRLLDSAPKEIESHAAVAGARAALALAEESGELGDGKALAARLERDPDDHDARYQLATVLFLRGQSEAAMDHLIQIVRRDRGWNDDKARKQLLRFFDALGAKNPATLKGRRMLSTLLFS